MFEKVKYICNDSMCEHPCVLECEKGSSEPYECPFGMGYPSWELIEKDD